MGEEIAGGGGAGGENTRKKGRGPGPHPGVKPSAPREHAGQTGWKVHPVYTTSVHESAKSRRTTQGEGNGTREIRDRDSVDPRKGKRMESPAPRIRSSPATGRDLCEDPRLSRHERGTATWPSPLGKQAGEISVKVGPPSPRPQTLGELP